MSISFKDIPASLLKPSFQELEKKDTPWDKFCEKHKLPSGGMDEHTLLAWEAFKAGYLSCQQDITETLDGK